MSIAFKNEFLVQFSYPKLEKMESASLFFICLYCAVENCITVEFVFSSDAVLFAQWPSSGCFFLTHVMSWLDGGFVHFNDYTQWRPVKMCFLFMFSLSTRRSSFYHFLYSCVFFLPELILDGLSWMGRLTGIIHEMSLDLLSALNFHFMCNTFFAI